MIDDEFDNDDIWNIRWSQQTEQKSSAFYASSFI